VPELIRSGQWAVTLLNTVPRSVGVTISSATYKGPLYRFDLLRNAWCELQGRLADFPGHARNGDVLWGQADSAWEAIPMSYINTLVDSMPRRLDTVRAAQGGETKY